MQYTKQSQYDEFRCIASDCPASCCCGWQIVIDEDSKKKYRKLKGDIGRLVREGMDEEHGIFRQNKGRCALLREDDLCELQKQCGEEALCKTCRMYPRHEEEFENVRELSLSMSCPEAARMMLTDPASLSFQTFEDEKEECYEEFDFFLYDKVAACRSIMYRIAEDGTIPLTVRMERILSLAGQLQDLYDDGRLGEAEDLFQEFSEHPGQDLVYGSVMGDSAAFAEKLREDLAQLARLERLRDEWGEVLTKTGEYCFREGDERCLARVKGVLDGKGGMQTTGGKLLIYFLYTIFCGAVYNGMIFAKAALICHSAAWILLIARAEEEEGLKPSGREGSTDRDLPAESAVDRLIRAAYRYCREVEHSDSNLNTLEDLFDGDYVLERSKRNE